MTDTTPYPLPPALPPRPIQWRRAARVLSSLLREPEKTEKVFELFECVGGSGDEPTVQDCAAHPEGARLFRERPCLIRLLADRDALAAMPPGSFGHAYLSYARFNGFTADGLLRAAEKGGGEAERGLDPDRAWFFDRVKLMHDLWHVLTGYGTDPAGEAGLVAFSIGQGLASRTLKLLLVAAVLRGPKRDRFAFQRFLFQAWRRGRGAAPLFVQRYEELLPRPLDEVLRELRIAPCREAHPGGIIQDEHAFGMREVTA